MVFFSLTDVIILLFSVFVGAVIEGPRDKIYYPNQGPVELTCNISEGSTGWRVNGSDRVFTITNLREGELAGHNVSGANSLLVINATNNTQYRCVSIRDAGDVDSDPAFLYIAGTYVCDHIGLLTYLIKSCIRHMYTYVICTFT